MSEPTHLVLTTGTGVLATGRFLFGSKRDSSGSLNAEEWLVVLFIPVVPRRGLLLTAAAAASGSDGALAVVEASRQLSTAEIGNRLASSLAGAVAVALTSAAIYTSSSNTGLLGGLVVVCAGGLLVAAAGCWDWLHPRVEPSRANDRPDSQTR